MHKGGPCLVLALRPPTPSNTNPKHVACKQASWHGKRRRGEQHGSGGTPTWQSKQEPQPGEDNSRTLEGGVRGRAGHSNAPIIGERTRRPNPAGPRTAPASL